MVYMMLIWSGSRENYAHPEFHMERHLMPRTLPSTNGPTDWNEALDIISFGSPEQVFYCLILISFIVNKLFTCGTRSLLPLVSN